MSFSLFSPSVSLHVVLVLAHFLWQGLALGLLAALGSWLLRRRSAQSRYLLHLTVLGLMALCLPGTSLFVSRSNTPKIIFSPAPPIADLPTAIAEAPAALPEIPDVPPAEVLPQRTPVPTAGGWQALAPYLMLLYLLGVAAMLGRFAWGLAASQRVRRSREPVRDPALLEMVTRRARALGLRVVPAVAYAERIAVPVVVGVLRPTILLPVVLASNLLPQEIEAILTHELAHLRRYDPLVNFVQRLIEAVLFFHPCVWYLSRQLGREREHCCDDLVLACGEAPLAYAQSLLRIAELSLRASRPKLPRYSGALHSSGDRPSQLRGRIVRLLGDQEDARVRLSRSGLWTFAAILALGVLLALPVRSTAVTQRDTKHERDVPKSPPSEATKAVSGQVVDEQGHPLAGVALWLRIKFDQEAFWKHQKPRFTLEGRSDANGSFQFQVPKAWLTAAGPSDRYVSPSLWAYADGRELATKDQFFQELVREDRPMEMRITLGPALETSLLVRDPEGKPLAGATVRPRNFRTNPLFSQGIPEDLASILCTKTDADGQARLRGISSAKLGAVEITSVFGQQTQYRSGRADQDRPIITLHRVGRLEGRVTAENPAWVRGLLVRFVTMLDGELEGEAIATTDEQGGFVVPTIAEGSLRSFLQVDESLPVRPQVPQNIQISPGGTTSLEIRLVPTDATQAELPSRVAAPEPTKSLSGQVVDEQNQPVAGAQLFLVLPSESSAATPEAARSPVTGQSDAQGRFQLDVPMARLNAIDRNERQFTSLWAVTAEKRFAVRFNVSELFASYRASAIRLVLLPTRESEILVRDWTDHPVPGARVSCLPLLLGRIVGFLPEPVAAVVEATTNAEGCATLATVVRKDLGSAPLPIELMDEVAVITDRFGTQAFRRRWSQRQTLQLRPVGRLEGRVTAEREELVRGVTVRITTGPDSKASPSKWLEGQTTAVTDNHGRFEVPAIACGKVSAFTQSKPPYLVAPLRPEAAEVTTGTVCHLEIPLVHGIPISGTVREKESHAPVAGAGVTLSGSGLLAVSDAAGKFTSWVLPGKVTATLHPTRQASYVRERTYVTTVVPADATQWELPPLEVRPSSPIPGRLVDFQGHDVAGATITASIVSHDYDVCGMTDAQGQFALYGAPAGIRLQDLVSPWVRLKDQSEACYASVLQTDPLVLSVATNQAFQGTVIDPEGKTVVGAMVEAILPEGARWHERRSRTENSTQSDSDGHYLLKVRSSHRPTAITITAPGHNLAALVPLPISQGPEPSPLTLDAQLKPTGRVVGRLWVDGQPRAGMQVSLSGYYQQTSPKGVVSMSGPVLTDSVSTDEAGEYVFEGVLAGVPLRLMTSETDGQLQSVTVQPGETVELPLQHLLKQPKSLAGVVVDSHGHPVLNAEVQVHLRDPKLGELPHHYTHTVAQDGSFRIHLLPNLPMRVTALIRTAANDPNYRILASTEVDAHAGDESVRIVLDPK